MAFGMMRLVVVGFAILSVFSLVKGAESVGGQTDATAVGGANSVNGTDEFAKAKDYWEDAEMTTACFEGKGKKPAKIKLPGEGFVKGLRFIYQSGEVNCLNRNKDWAAKWGCNTKSWNLKGKIGVVVTDKHQNVLLPIEARLQPRKNFYYTGGLDPMANEITFYDDIKPTFLDESTELSLWYAEDLWNMWSHDNVGKVCLRAQVLYANME